MSRKLQIGVLSLVLAAFLMPEILSGVAYGQNHNVTFRVNMSIKMREGTFQPGSGDIVTVPGSHNGWNTSADTLKDGDADSIYTITKSLAAATYDYKFWKTLRGGLDWEGGSNKQVIVSKDTTLPVLWFDGDSVFTPAVNQNVTFAVNMKIKLQENAFQPQSGDVVTVPGSFNGWNTATDTLKDADGDSIYTKVISLLENTTVNYKFYKTQRAGEDWEGDPNRSFTVPVGGGSPAVVFFNRDTVVNQLVSGTVLWSVDMTAFEQMGWFRRSQGDSMQVRGSFNGWSSSNPGNSKLDRVPGTEVYELSVPFDSPPNTDFAYKYFMKFDTTNIAARWPGFSGDPDGFQYEHPTERGDGNRLFSSANGGQLSAPTFYFGSINPGGVINQGDTVTVTFRIDMRPAVSYVDAFVPGTDTVYVVWQDKPAKSKQGNPPDIKLSDSDGDTIYTGTLTIRGPAHYNLLYFVRYNHPGGGAVEEGAGLGAQNGYRSRYITPTAANSFPRNFTLPIDVWQKNPPYPADAPPLVTDIEDVAPLGPPDKFTLAQNYPNPFNPSTNIRFNLAKQTRVSLKVFNLLGQEIVTLVDGVQPAGEHMVVFEARRLAAGIYFYALQAGDYREVKKMILLK